MLYYPADLKKAGYDEFPKTFAELMDAARKLTKYDTKGNPIHWGFDFMTTDNIPYLFLSFILQQNGSYWAADKIHVKFTTPEAQKAMQAMADMVLKDKVTEIKHLSDTNNDASNYFFKGESSMCFRGPWVIPVGTDEFELDNFSYGPMPSFTGTSKAFAAESGWGEVVSARTKNAGRRLGLREVHQLRGEPRAVEHGHQHHPLGEERGGVQGLPPDQPDDQGLPGRAPVRPADRPPAEHRHVQEPDRRQQLHQPLHRRPGRRDDAEEDRGRDEQR